MYVVSHEDKNIFITWNKRGFSVFWRKAMLVIFKDSG